jgi:hypothetical protein
MVISVVIMSVLEHLGKYKDLSGELLALFGF